MPTLSSPLRWELKRYDELCRDELYELLALRAEVFVTEQRSPYTDPDGKDRDPQARHLLGRDESGVLAAYLRLLPPGASYAQASFGRVVTAPAFRGRGLGDELVVLALQYIAQLWPNSDIRIGAQAHLAQWYGKHGFVVDSEIYDEDGIPHRKMLRRAS